MSLQNFTKGISKIKNDMVGSVKIAQLLYVSFLTQPRRNLIAFNYLLTCMRELVYDLLEFLTKIKV